MINKEKIHYDTKEREHLIEEVSKVVSHFLSSSSVAFRGWTIDKIICETEHIIYYLNATNAHCNRLENTHFRDVDALLPYGFTLSAPVSGMMTRDGSERRVARLEFDIKKGQYSFKKGRFLRVFILGFFFLMGILFALYMGLAVRHTSKDADPAGSIWRILSGL